MYLKHLFNLVLFSHESNSGKQVKNTWHSNVLLGIFNTCINNNSDSNSDKDNHSDIDSDSDKYANNNIRKMEIAYCVMSMGQKKNKNNLSPP